MRLWRSRVVEDATPPTYTSVDDFVSHALRYPENGWYELLFGRCDEVGTVDRCLQLNSQQLASMKLRYRHSQDTQGFQPVWVTDPDPAWFPNGIYDAVFAAVWSIYATGDAFLWVTSRYQTGYPRTWTVLNAEQVQVDDRGGVRGYRQNSVRLDPGDVLQVQRDPRGGLRGRSALEAYSGNVASASAADRYASGVYATTGVNRMALRAKGRISEEQAHAIQSQWVTAVGQRNGAPPVIDDRIEMLETLSVSPKDMMLLDSREWDARQIAAAFGVPAVLLNIGVSGGLFYQNPAMLADLWWRSELMPVAEKLQQALSRWLPRGHWVEFDPSQALRPDLGAMTTTWSKLYADGVVTVDEYRAAVLDLPPLALGDEARELFEEAGAHGSVGSSPTPDEIVEVTT